MLTVKLSALPPLPRQKDLETAVAYAKALKALFEQQAAASPHIPADLIKQAIDNSLQQQLMLSSSRGSTLVISPDEVTPWLRTLACSVSGIVHVVSCVHGIGIKSACRHSVLTGHEAFRSSTSYTIPNPPAKSEKALTLCHPFPCATAKRDA